MKNIALIDSESINSSTSTGVIFSLGGILLSPELEKLDSFEFFCHNKPGHVLDPYSMWVNRGFHKMMKSNMSSLNMWYEFHKIVKKWQGSNGCIWGTWNGHGFDFPFIEKENYRALLPSYILKQNGNEAADFLPFARASKIFYPDSFKAKKNVKGNFSFKLTDLAEENVNNLDKSSLHTSAGDCKIVWEILKKMQKNAKPVFDSFRKTTTKALTEKTLEDNRIFTAVFYWYGKSRPTICTKFATHSEFGWPIIYALENSPKDLINLSKEALKEILKKPGKFCRPYPLNKNNVCLHYSYGMTLDIYKTLGIEKIKERANTIHSNQEFCKNVGEVLGELAREKKEKSNDKKTELVENLLYGGGWPTKPDEEKMTAFHATDDWGERNKIAGEFDDERYRYLGKRLIYQNQSDALSKKEYKEIHTDIARKILNVEEDRFTTIPMSEKLCDDMRNEKGISKEKLDYINEIDEWLHQQRRIYEKAS